MSMLIQDMNQKRIKNLDETLKEAKEGTSSPNGKAFLCREKDAKGNFVQPYTQPIRVIAGQNKAQIENNINNPEVIAIPIKGPKGERISLSSDFLDNSKNVKAIFAPTELAGEYENMFKKTGAAVFSYDEKGLVSVYPKSFCDVTEGPDKCYCIEDIPDKIGNVNIDKIAIEFLPTYFEITECLDTINQINRSETPFTFEWDNSKDYFENRSDLGSFKVLADEYLDTPSIKRQKEILSQTRIDYSDYVTIDNAKVDFTL